MRDEVLYKYKENIPYDNMKPFQTIFALNHLRNSLRIGLRLSRENHAGSGRFGTQLIQDACEIVLGIGTTL